MASSDTRPLISSTQLWKDLEAHARDEVAKTHLRDLMQDPKRCDSMVAEHDGIFLDYSRQRATHKTISMLFDLAENAGVARSIANMRSGQKINTSEDRAVLHAALRADAGDTYSIAGEQKNVVDEVLEVREQIKAFSEDVRSGKWQSVTGKPITDFVAIGIGGSYLGGEFVSEALRTDPTASKGVRGRLRFLANVDPVDVARALDGLDPETTMGIVISKTFTTAETMLNARTVRNWFTSKLGDKSEVIQKHMIAVSSNPSLVEKFGIDPKNTFRFWDWVGGRYSVTSAVGLVPLALQYGYGVVEQFLKGCRSIDQHFFTAKPRANLPMLLGLLGVWNSTFLKYPTRSLACYSQALHKFAPHIQQVDMESNGKRVTAAGTPVDFSTGEINFGEPGTNSQHSFFQLFHKGQVVPVDFIGFCQSQQPVELKSEEVSNHDELMSNFFAQPDALAVGKTVEELKADGIADNIVPHKVMPGNRPSNVLLLDKLDAYSVGQLLALYEHRTAVQGFVWGINSFDQMGVELGKILATKVRKQLKKSRADAAAAVEEFNPSTTKLLTRYITHKL